MREDIEGCQYSWVSNSELTLTPVQTAACCSPLVSEPLDAVRASAIAPLLKALADPVRLRLLSLVAVSYTHLTLPTILLV